MIPTEQHVRLLFRIYCLLMNGYRSRNPLTTHRQQQLYGEVNSDTSNRRASQNSPGNLAFLTGLSGMGKTKLMNSIMEATGKPVIFHSNYKGKDFPEAQILYLKRNVPDQCSARSVCKSISVRADELIGENLYAGTSSDKRSRGDIVLSWQKMINNHHVGALIIDEFQNLALGRSGGREEVLALFHNLRDELGVPIILVGTYKAAALLKQDPSLARRITEGGFHELKRPESPIDENWQSFCEILWGYQWVRNPLPINDEIVTTLYECSQGITGIMISLFVTAQTSAIEVGKETITPQFIQEIYADRFRPVHRIIQLLRENNPEVLCQYDDLYFDAMSELNVDPMQNRIKNLHDEINRQREDLLNNLENDDCKKPRKLTSSAKSPKNKPTPQSLHDALRAVGQAPSDIFGGAA